MVSPSAFNTAIDDITQYEQALRDMGIWDPSLSPQDITLRFKLFEGIALGVIPKSDWGAFLRDLLPYERQFWYG